MENSFLFLLTGLLRKMKSDSEEIPERVRSKNKHGSSNRTEVLNG
jgi:hypothetical protein